MRESFKHIEFLSKIEDNLKKKSNEELEPKIEELRDFYNLSKLFNGIEIWRSHWEEKNLSQEQLLNR